MLNGRPDHRPRAHSTLNIRHPDRARAAMTVSSMSDPPRFDDAALIRLRAILRARPAIEIDAPKLKRAAVLIPLIPTGGGWSLLFSRRSKNLAAHSGQIAFPGGGVHPGETLEAAAVGESHEEVGSASEGGELIGPPVDFFTFRRFLVAPFSAVLDPRFLYMLQT